MIASRVPITAAESTREQAERGGCFACRWIVCNPGGQSYRCDWQRARANKEAFPRQCRAYEREPGADDGLITVSSNEARRDLAEWLTQNDAATLAMLTQLAGSFGKGNAIQIRHKNPALRSHMKQRRDDRARTAFNTMREILK